MSSIASLVSSKLDPFGKASVELSALTVRLDEFERRRLDLFCQFLGVSRQHFLRAAVSDALALAEQSLSEGEGTRELQELCYQLDMVLQDEAETYGRAEA